MSTIALYRKCHSNLDVATTKFQCTLQSLLITLWVVERLFS